MIHVFRRVVVVGAVFFSVATNAQVSFENKTSELGPFYSGTTWGAAWGDINNDYYPDLVVNNHFFRHGLWINQAGQAFRNGILQFDRSRVFTSDIGQDSHGTTLADLDNDGYQDVIGARSSGSGRVQIFMNDQGFGIEQAASMGLNYLTAGRMGVVYDYNNDGLLDFFYASSSRARNRVFKNNGNNNFTDVTAQTPNYNSNSNCGGLNYYQFTDIIDDSNGTPNFEIFCVDETEFPKIIYNSNGSDQLVDVSDYAEPVSNTVDTASGDFDGDGINDLLAIRGSIRFNGASLVSEDRIEAWMTVQSSTGAKSFTFESDGLISIDELHIPRDNTPVDQFRIGSQGDTFTSFPIVLDKNDPSAQGISSSTAKGIYIGYDTATLKWTVSFRSVGFEDFYLVLSGDGLSEPDDLVLHPAKDQPNLPILFKNTGTGFDRIWDTGIGAVTCASIAAGDFDNDMDLDIYLSCGRGVENISNKLYLNDGTGYFTEVVAHGAEGIIGKGIEQGAGVGESVAMADYDLDGRLDLFTTNGAMYSPEDEGGGPHELFRNTTANSNNWIELDLIGTTVNRDAMGAKVIASTGSIDQTREQNGGYHRWSQNHKRIHFGLAQNATVDITVKWPDGSQDTYSNLTANSLYEVSQNGAAVAITPSGFIDYPAPVAGEECSDRGQAYTSSIDKSVFLLKDCSTGMWSLRSMSGNSAQPISFTGHILSESPIPTMTKIEFEVEDSATVSGRRLDFSMNSSGDDIDGFDFDLGSSTNACIVVENEDSIVVGEFHLLAPNKLDLIQMGACDLNSDGSLNVPDKSSIETGSLVIPGSGGSETFSIDLTGLGLSIGDDVDVSQLLADGDLNGSLEYFSLNFNSGEYTLGQQQTGFDCSGTLQATNDDLNQTISVIDIGGGVPGITISGSTTSQVSGACNDVEFQLTISVPDNFDDGTSTLICGAPSYTPSVDAGLYVWKDCAGSEKWFVRATSGGSSTLIDYEVEFLAESAISSVETFSFEGLDNFGFSLSDKLLSVEMSMFAGGQDGIEFALPSDSELCLSLANASQTIYIGETKLPYASEVNLNALSLACASQPDIPALSASDVTAAEAAGEAVVEVNLSAASTGVVTVDFATSDGTAIAGQDYSSVSGSLTFAAGELSKSISIPITQDTNLEESESFNLLLSNSNNADIVNSGTLVTIDDAGCVSPTNGDQWLYEYYEGGWTSVPDFDNELLVASGTTNSISTAEALSNDNYGLRFTGCIDVPVSGNYTFDTTSDDGSLLYVDNNVVVNNDGLHGARTVTEDSFLEAGVHQITVEFFERTGKSVLSANWVGPLLACGQPSYSAADDAGLFLWKACDVDDTWYLSATAGGGGAINYLSTFTANATISILNLISFEASDSATLSNSDQQLDLEMTMGSIYTDTIQFNVGTDGACLYVDSPTDIDVVVGQSNAQLTPPFNIVTMDPC